MGRDCRFPSAGCHAVMSSALCRVPPAWLQVLLPLFPLRQASDINAAKADESVDAGMLTAVVSLLNCEI